jgi:hypothetical protein
MTGVTGPVDVTLYLCPALAGMMVTHVLQPRLAGKVGDEVEYERACVWCLYTETQLRDDIVTAGGQLAPLDFSAPVEPRPLRQRGPRHRA